MKRSILALVVMACAVLLVAGCGDDTSASDKLAEKLVEGSGGGKVDIDSEGDEVTIKGKDGDATFSSKGELPEGWPDEVELPDDAKISASSSFGDEATGTKTVSASTKDSVEEVAKHFGEQFGDWKETSSGTFGSGADAVSTGTWTKDALTATLTVSGSAEDGTTFVVGIVTDSSK